MPFGGGGSSNTQVVSNEPPGFLVPHITDFLSQAKTLSGKPPITLPSGQDQVAPLSGAENTAINSLTNTVQNGSPLLDAARQNLISQMGPDAAFNPLTNQLVDQAQSNIVDQFNLNVAPSTAARFARGGTTGSTAQQELESVQRFDLSRGLAQAEGDIRNQALGRGLQAASISPSLNQASLANTLGLAGLGSEQRGVEQAIRTANLNNLLFQDQAPISRLGILGNAINIAGGGFGTQTSQVPQVGNPFIAGLGAGGSFLGGLGSLYSSGIFG